MVRKKDLQAIKEQMKREKAERKKDKLKHLKADDIFFNKMAAYIVGKDLHIDTIYKMIKIPHMSEMLSNLYEETIKELNLHKPTIEAMRDPVIREDMEREIERRTGRKRTIQV